MVSAKKKIYWKFPNEIPQNYFLKAKAYKCYLALEDVVHGKKMLQSIPVKKQSMNI